MNRYKVAIVEDDKKSSDLLSSFIDRYARENGAIIQTETFETGVRFLEKYTLDFVLKPVSYFSFSLKIKKALSYSLRQKDDGICLETTEGPVKLRTADIYYLETEKHYIIIHTSRGDYKMRASMTETEEIFKNRNFARCNTSYLVNLSYVSKIKKYTVFVGEAQLPVSRARKTPFLNALTRYTGGNRID